MTIAAGGGAILAKRVRGADGKKIAGGEWAKRRLGRRPSTAPSRATLRTQPADQRADPTAGHQLLHVSRERSRATMRNEIREKNHGREVRHRDRARSQEEADHWRSAPSSASRPSICCPTATTRRRSPPTSSPRTQSSKDGKLILVTAINPTPAGEGKTTTTVGLGDGLNRIGKKAIVCIREPSLGPCFGMKGGAAGGGYAQVVPMEDINLHFTGDFHAITTAHNLLSALIDNHIYWGNELGIDTRRVAWRRVMDMNDRALREIVVLARRRRQRLSARGRLRHHGRLRGDGDPLPRHRPQGPARSASATSSSPTAATRAPVYARDLKADGAMTVLLKDAMQPNLVQTLENNPAFVHGGPFANIAHGCNSVVATTTALKLADYVVTEAGFGADLGAEKFFDIKCRKAGPEAGGGRHRRHRARHEDERRRQEGRPRQGERRGGQEGLRQSRPPHREREASSACRSWSPSTTSSPTPTPRSRR